MLPANTGLPSAGGGAAIPSPNAVHDGLRSTAEDSLHQSVPNQGARTVAAAGRARGSLETAQGAGHSSVGSDTANAMGCCTLAAEEGKASEPAMTRTEAVKDTPAGSAVADSLLVLLLLLILLRRSRSILRRT
jgi:hypothetical protein